MQDVININDIPMIGVQKYKVSIKTAKENIESLKGQINLAEAEMKNYPSNHFITTETFQFWSPESSHAHGTKEKETFDINVSDKFAIVGINKKTIRIWDYGGMGNTLLMNKSDLDKVKFLEPIM